MSGEKTFSLEPMQNGVDFVLSAVQHLEHEEDPRQLKYGILHLFSGVEILLKLRLREEHWALVFDDLDDASEELLARGQFRTVGFDRCISRLEDICGVSISERRRKYLRNLRDLRNGLIHFGASDSIERVKSIAAVVLGFVVDFLDAEFGGPLPASIADQVAEIRAGLREFSRFVEQRIKEISGELARHAGYVVTCSSCLLDALVIDDGPHCLFCRHSADAETEVCAYMTRTLGYSHYRAVKDGGQWPVRACPACGREAFVRVELSGLAVSTVVWLCFDCGERAQARDLVECDHCGELRPELEPGMGICTECFRRKVEDD
jgi:hypothetical protein